MRATHFAAILCLATIGLTACAEQALCVEGRIRGRDTVVLQCSTGKVPVCGDDPARLYSEASGGLLPTQPEPDLTDDAIRRSFNGACEGVSGRCRPRPTCQGAAGDAPTCATGETVFCVLGGVTTPPDAGDVDPVDAGGSEDAGPGDTDAGPGDTDAGPGDTDAGPGDTDSGPGDTDSGPGDTDAGPGADSGA